MRKLKEERKPRETTKVTQLEDETRREPGFATIVINEIQLLRVRRVARRKVDAWLSRKYPYIASRAAVRCANRFTPTCSARVTIRKPYSRARDGEERRNNSLFLVELMLRRRHDARRYIHSRRDRGVVPTYYAPTRRSVASTLLRLSCRCFRPDGGKPDGEKKSRLRDEAMSLDCERSLNSTK